MATLFDFNWCDYSLVDLTRAVTVSEENGADVKIIRRRMPNGTFSYEVVSASNHAGTHVELPRHFYEDGKSLEDFPLSAFMGRGSLAAVRRPDNGLIDAESLESSAGKIVRRDDILVVRIDPAPAAAPSGERDESAACIFTVDAAHWMLGKGIKMLVFDSIGMGRTIPEEREFHDILLGRDIPIIHSATNLEKLTRPEFYVIAWPVKFCDSGSLWVRLGAILAR